MGKLDNKNDGNTDKGNGYYLFYSFHLDYNDFNKTARIVMALKAILLGH